jgi:tetratricopeptide (TPR) repeat protein
MERDSRQEHPEDVGVDAARCELDRVLADPAFHATERNKAFLRYVCNEAFAGRAAAIKAYAVAIDVFGRPSNFNASTDPIVRIEATRLRSALDNYYLSAGNAGTVRLHLPKGGYIPVFYRVFNAVNFAGEEDPIVGSLDMPTPVKNVPGRHLPSHIRMIAVVTILAAVGMSVAVWWSAHLPLLTSKPLVTIRMQPVEARFSSEAQATEDYLLVALSKFRTLRIAKPNVLPAGSGAADVSLDSAGAGSYSIALKYYAEASERSVWWQVVDADSGEVLQTGVERVATEGVNEQTVKERLVIALAQRFATSRGVISALETHDEASRSHLGNACVLRAEHALDGMGTDRLAGALDCLTRTLRVRPEDPDVKATLSRSLIASELGHLSPATLEQALGLANAAVSVAPESDRASLSLMFAQYFSGRTEAAINAGNRALALNPFDPEVSAKFSMVLFMSGYFERAVALASAASTSATAVPRDADLVLALEAYRTGDYVKASLRAEQMPGNDFLTAALRAAALGQIGSPDAVRALAALKVTTPDLAAAFSAKMTSRRFDPAVTALIAAGLVKAGMAAAEKFADARD